MTDRLQTLQTLGIAAALLDGERRIISVNAPLADILQMSEATPIGQDFFETLRTASSIETGFTDTFRFDTETGAGWYRVKADGTGIAILIDVTPEYRSLIQLREYYSTRDKLLLDGKIGTWRFDPDAEVYYFSSELSLGHDNATAPVPVSLLQQIQHPDDRERDTQIREHVTREGGAAEAEIRYREASGSWTHLHVHYRAGRRTNSGLFEMFGISQNITPVALARDEASQISQTLSFALQAGQAGVFGYNYADGTFWSSPELGALIGGDAVRAVGHDPVTLFIPEDREVVREFFFGAGQRPHARSIDVRVAQPGGTRWVRFYFDVTEKDQGGAPVHGVGLLIDIDEIKRQEIALGEAQRAAEFANRTKTEFLANMSHELRTPLNAILGFSEVLTRQMFGPMAAKYVDYARDIHRSGRHLLELVNDVLDLAKLEAGKLELRESDVDLGRLADQCLALVRNRADADGVSLSTAIAPNVPRLRADERALTQLLLNFLSNAVKFTPADGRVVIEARYRAQGGIDLSVTDTGIGMSEREIEIALSPFGQIDSTLTRKSEGTGLGLPICKSLIELHGGELLVESRPNAGTTLTARFPATRSVVAEAGLKLA
jgi:signal transduction histidine kinase